MRAFIYSFLAVMGAAALAVSVSVPWSTIPATQQSPSKEIIMAEPSPSPSPEKGKEVHIMPIEIQEPVKQGSKKDLVMLGSKNSLVLRGPISENSVASIQKKLMQMSARLNDNDTIYLVIDSPGGSVIDGKMFIDTAQGLPQKIKTVTIFSASMAFQVVQNLDERLITPSGTLMSHRAKLGGIGGEISSDGKGELMTELNWLLKILTELDQQASDRMGKPLKDYLELIHDEYWVNGSTAVKDKAADRVVLVRCAKDLIEGSDVVTLQTFFGPIKLEYSSCPLIQSPLSVDMSRAFTRSKSDAEELSKFIKELTENKRAFVKDYIVTDKLQTILK
jgi:ATP-dependent protease ClpP protease subunit